MKAPKQECLERLQALSNGVDDLLAFLVDEKIVSAEQFTSLVRSSTKYRELAVILKGSDKIQLLEYEWQILPTERVKITIVTEQAQKIVSYGF